VTEMLTTSDVTAATVAETVSEIEIQATSDVTAAIVAETVPT